MTQQYIILNILSVMKTHLAFNKFYLFHILSSLHIQSILGVVMLHIFKKEY